MHLTFCHHFLALSFSLLSLVLFTSGGAASPWESSSIRGEFAAPPSPAAAQNATLEYMDPTRPPLLPAHGPKCSLLVLQQDFANTVGIPPALGNYTPPPDCPAPWSRVILELSASASDLQKDRIAAVWLDGAEILRTTTPFPMSPGVFWRVRKDVTRYTALLRRTSADGGGIISMMLENSNATYPGVYSVNVSLHFYRGVLRSSAVGEQASDKIKETKLESVLSTHPTIKGIYREPADVIIPISNGDGRRGFWFPVMNETDIQTDTVIVPNNTYRAVLEVYVSHHGDDEYWYANPLRSNEPQLARDGLEPAKSNGGFRQVVATIDGRYAGSVVPFPVIYPGSINPFFWAPVAAIGAYDHPSYDLDLTPFVGQLIDGMPHEFGLTIRDSQPFWLVSANLHLWLDAWSDSVEGALVRYKAPPLRLSRQADWKDEEGKSEMEGHVVIKFSGWVSSSIGNITTSLVHKIEFKSQIEAEEKGEVTTVEMENNARTDIRIVRDEVVIGRLLVETEAPLNIMTMSSNGTEGSRFHKTKLYHMLEETRSMVENKMPSFSTIADRQESKGSVLMHEGVALSGSGNSKSSYKFRDDKACYMRTVSMVGGKVEKDEDTASCAAVAAF